MKLVLSFIITLIVGFISIFIMLASYGKNKYYKK